MKQEMMVWQWHQLGHMLQTDNHTSTSSLNILLIGCSSCHPTNTVKTLKAAINVLYCFQ